MKGEQVEYRFVKGAIVKRQPLLKIFGFLRDFLSPPLRELLTRTDVGREVISDIVNSGNVSFKVDDLLAFIEKVKTFLSVVREALEECEGWAEEQVTADEIKEWLKNVVDRLESALPTKSPQGISMDVSITVAVPEVVIQYRKKKQPAQQPQQTSQQQTSGSQQTSESPEVSVSLSSAGEVVNFNKTYTIKLNTPSVLLHICREAVSSLKRLSEANVSEKPTSAAGEESETDKKSVDLGRYKTDIKNTLSQVATDIENHFRLLYQELRMIDQQTLWKLDRITGEERELVQRIAEAVGALVIYKIQTEKRRGLFGWVVASPEETHIDIEEALGRVYDYKALIRKFKKVSPQEASEVMSVIIDGIRKRVASTAFANVISLIGSAIGLVTGGGRLPREFSLPRGGWERLEDIEEVPSRERETTKVIEILIEELKRIHSSSRADERLKREIKDLVAGSSGDSLNVLSYINNHCQYLGSQIGGFLKNNKEVLRLISVSKLRDFVKKRGGFDILFKEGRSLLVKQIRVKPPKKPKPIKKLPPLPKAVEQILLWWKNLTPEGKRVISKILHSYLTEVNPDIRKALEKELIEVAKKLGIPIRALKQIEKGEFDFDEE